MLEIRNLHSHYGLSHVLQGVTMSAQTGVVTAVLGRNRPAACRLCRQTWQAGAQDGRLQLVEPAVDAQRLMIIPRLHSMPA